MPRRDGTGPQGMGAMTGRGVGRCLNTVFSSDQQTVLMSRGRGRGNGLGRGMTLRTHETNPRNSASDEVESKINLLSQQLNRIEKLVVAMQSRTNII